MAAVSAALAAKSQGSDVTVIAGRPGATAMASGAWDIATDDPRNIYLERDQLLPPKEVISNISESCPEHPYSILGNAIKGKSVFETIETSLKALTDHMPRRPHGSINEVMALLTPIGSIKYTALSDAAHSGGNLFNWRKVNLLIAGIPGLAGFPLSIIYKVLTTIILGLNSRIINTVKSAWINIEGVPQHSLSPFALAQRLEDDSAMDSFIESLKVQVKETKSSHVLLPPVMGIEKNSELMDRLNSEVGAVCFESLATVPSVPGLRRHRAMESILKKINVTVLPGVVRGYVSSGKKITELILDGGDADHVFDFDKVILASGRFIGGGIVKSDDIKEAVFGLPVFAGDTPVTDAFVGNLVQRKYLGDHDLFKVGIHIDQVMRPLNRWEEPVFENLHAAGSLLGGYGAASDGSGTGVALLSGWVAGQKGAS
jgi:glycerol-3-phosphate dehydrogenase subunit B